MSEHVIDALFNNGWPDKPAWRAVCSCGWEAWDFPTEAEVAAAFDRHLTAGGRATSLAEFNWCYWS